MANAQDDAFERATDELRLAATEVVAGKRRFSVAFRAYKAAVPPISEARFWNILGQYRDILAGQLHRRQGYDAAKNAASELVRRAWAGDGGFKPDSLADVVAFARQYAARSDALGRALDATGDGIDLERSDDGYSDLIDALPLAGKGVCDRVERKGFRTNAEFEAAVRAEVLTHGAVHGPALARHILEGESYHDRSFDKALRHYLTLSMDATHE